MHREDIKSMIRKSGTTVVGLSVKLGYHRTAVSVALKRPWPELEQKIADYLALPVQTLFPSRYHSVADRIVPASNDNEQDLQIQSHA